MRASMLVSSGDIVVCSGFPNGLGTATSAGPTEWEATSLKRVEVNPCHLSTNHARRS